MKTPPAASAPAAPAAEAKPEGEHRMQIMIKQDMDYVYRDMFNVHVGLDEVILEFGNMHRVPENAATISDRIVVSVRNAVRLQQVLGKVILEAQEKALAETKKK
jgi:hypothetical protein